MVSIIGNILSTTWNYITFPFSYRGPLCIEDKKGNWSEISEASSELQENKLIQLNVDGSEPIELKVDKPVELKFDSPVKLKIDKSYKTKAGAFESDLSKKYTKRKTSKRSEIISCDKTIQVFPKFLLQPKSTQTALKLTQKAHDDLDDHQCGDVKCLLNEERRPLEITSNQNNVVNALAICKPKPYDGTMEEGFKTYYQNLICHPFLTDSEPKNVVSTTKVVKKKSKPSKVNLDLREVRDHDDICTGFVPPQKTTNKFLTIYVRVNNDIDTSILQNQILMHKKSSKKSLFPTGKVKRKLAKIPRSVSKAIQLHSKFTISSQMKMKADTSRVRSVARATVSKQKKVGIKGKCEKKISKPKKNLSYPFWLVGQNRSYNCNNEADTKGLQKSNIISFLSAEHKNILNNDRILENFYNSRNFQIEKDKEQFSQLPLLVSRNTKLLANLRKFKSNLSRKEHHLKLNDIRKSCMYSNLPTKFCSENFVVESTNNRQALRIKNGNDSKALKISFSVDSINIRSSTRKEILHTTDSSKINSTGLTPSEQFLLKSLLKIKKTKSRRKASNGDWNSIFIADHAKRKSTPHLSDIEILQNNKLSSDTVMRSHYHILTKDFRIIQ